MELGDYLRILRQRWMLITAVVLVALGAATALTLTSTPQYQSTARMFISTPESNSSDAYQGGLFTQQRVTSYASLITGEEMARRVLDELGEPGAGARALSEQISATVEPETVVLAVSATDPSPERAQQIAQTTAEVFTEYIAELETPPGRTAAPVKASITDPATASASPVSPQPVRNIGLALVLGLLLGVGLAVLRDVLDTRIKTPADLAQAAGGAPNLGHTEFDKKVASQPIVPADDTHSARAESYRVLRTNVQYVNVDAESRVLVVTSSMPSEGKSVTAANLAVSLADAGFRTLLIEADLRKPKASSYLDVVGSVGVTTVLLRKIAWRDAVQHTAWGCDVLAAGATPPNPAELLQSEAMSTLLAEVRQDYDVVIVDAPPLLPVADAALLAAQADGALLAVRHNTTTTDQVRGSADRLASVGAALLGTITTMTPPAKKGSRYGYGYGYGYGSGSGSGANLLEARGAVTPGKGRSRRAAAPEWDQLTEDETAEESVEQAREDEAPAQGPRGSATGEGGRDSRRPEAEPSPGRRPLRAQPVEDVDPAESGEETSTPTQPRNRQVPAGPPRARRRRDG